MTGSELEALRKEAGITRRALASALGIAEYTCWHTERHVACVTEEKTQRWLAAIGQLSALNRIAEGFTPEIEAPEARGSPVPGVHEEEESPKMPVSQPFQEFVAQTDAPGLRRSDENKAGGIPTPPELPNSQDEVTAANSGGVTETPAPDTAPEDPAATRWKETMDEIAEGLIADQGPEFAARLAASLRRKGQPVPVIAEPTPPPSGPPLSVEEKELARREAGRKALGLPNE